MTTPQQYVAVNVTLLKRTARRQTCHVEFTFLFLLFDPRTKRKGSKLVVIKVSSLINQRYFLIIIISISLQFILVLKSYILD